MKQIAKISAAFLYIVLIFTSGCNDKTGASPFDEILARPPYSALTDSIKKEPKRDDLYFKRAILLNKSNLPEPALADFQKAWSLKKEEKYALGVSTILMDKKPDSAIAFLNQALRDVPNSFLLQLTLARSYDAQNRTDEALKTCNTILQVNPEQVDVLKMKSSLLDKKGDTAESITTLEKAYSFTPFDLELNYMLALKYAESKNVKLLSLCDSLIKKDSLSVHAEPYYYKGIYYSNINDKSKALSMFSQATQHDYSFLDAYIEKGAILYEQKKYNEALKVFQLASTLSATFASAYYWMGKCQEQLGQKDEARLNYQRAYGLDKTFTEAKEAADRLSN
jgi:tetratricopeptide (TPR) repeat protein